MFNLFRMDLRRLFRTRSFYIVLVVTMGFLVLMVAMMAAVTNPETLDAMEASGMVVVEGDDRQMAEEIRGMSQLEFAYESSSSGFLLIAVGIGVTLFVNEDFSSGYVKNIYFVRPRRREYVLSKVLTAGVYSGVLVIAGILVVLVCPFLMGVPLAASPIVSVLQYTFWVWLPIWAFGLMGLALVLLTRSSTLGIILAVVSGGGLVPALVYNICQQFGWPDLSEYMLSSLERIQCVPMPNTEQMIMILACAAGWGLVYTAGSIIVMEKRDI